MSKEKFCPKCYSTDIDVLDSTGFAGGVPTQYTCKECSYTSFVFPESTKTEIKKIKKENKS